MLKRLPLAILLVGASSAWAQQVISAHSGVIHFVEGQVTLEGQPVQPKFAEFPDVKNGQTLATQDGRAEVLLNPGVILRIGENSSFKMLSNNRADTRLELRTGEAVVEVGELLPSNAITLVSGNVHMELVKKGLYRIDAEDPGKFRVYEGEARVTNGDQSVLARKGRQVLLGAVLDMNAFDVKDMDALMRWAGRRSEYLAEANVSAARSAGSLGYVGNSLGVGGMGLGGMGMGLGSWAYNPWYGMFTYMPYGNSMYYSPFGYAFYSPTTVAYMPMYNGFTGSAFPLSNSGTSLHYGSGGGGSTMAPRPSSGGGSGGPVSSAAPTTGLNGMSSSSSGTGGSAGHGGGSGAHGK
ncbi:MAG: FecR domain-containing protein [Bryobacteraceae bacterium]|jgi:FecR-like protein